MKNLIVMASLCLAAVSCTTNPTQPAASNTPQPRNVSQVSNQLADKIRSMESQYKKCTNSPEGYSTQGSIACSNTLNNAADAELNKLYKNVMAKLNSSGESTDKETAKRLKSAQQTWIPFRDAHCKLDGATGGIGGTLEKQLIAACIATETVERVKDLNNLFGYAY